MGWIAAILMRFWPFLLLLALILLALRLYRKRFGKSEKELPKWQADLWLYCFMATLALLVLTIILYVVQFEDNTTLHYSPAHIEDGTIVPGGFN